MSASDRGYVVVSVALRMFFSRRREVAIPGLLLDDLAAHVVGTDPDDLVFGGIRNALPLRVSSSRLRRRARRLGSDAQLKRQDASRRRRALRFVTV